MKYLIPVLVLMLLLVGCGLGLKTHETTAMERLVDAQKWYNGMMQEYREYYDASSEAERLVLEREVSPVCLKASRALDEWDIYVELDDSYKYEQRWNRARDKMYCALKSAGVIE